MTDQTQFSRNESLLKYALEKLKVSIQDALIERPKTEWDLDGLDGVNLPITRDDSFLKVFEKSGSGTLHLMDRSEFRDSGLLDRFRTLLPGSSSKFIKGLFDDDSKEYPPHHYDNSLSTSQKKVPSSKYAAQVSH
jgi:hypothetical protein